MRLAVNAQRYRGLEGFQRDTTRSERKKEEKKQEKRDEMTGIDMRMSSGISERGVSCIRSLHWNIGIRRRLDLGSHTGSGLAFGEGS